MAVEKMLHKNIIISLMTVFTFGRLQSSLIWPHPSPPQSSLPIPNAQICENNACCNNQHYNNTVHNFFNSLEKDHEWKYSERI